MKSGGAIKNIVECVLENMSILYYIEIISIVHELCVLSEIKLMTLYPSYVNINPKKSIENHML